MAILKPQVDRHPDVEIKIHDAGRSMPTGTKRNHLKDGASMSDYFCFIDCDDIVPVYYIDEIMKALESNPDVVTFNGYMTTNGKDRMNFTIKLGEKYEERNKHYYRFPNHLTVMKTKLVSSVRFPDIWIGEDYYFAKQINDMRLLKSEIHLDRDMYIYDYRTNKPKK